jgi:tryptophan synthase alpha chain
MSNHPSPSSINRIDLAFERLKKSGKAGFIAYITGGDPDLKATVSLALALDGAGCDILELGVPFSDPLADGATIQAAAGRALAAGATIDGLFETLREIRKTSEIPVVLFTYLNPVYAYGFERFHSEAVAAGADGVLILDLPPDEALLNAEFTGSQGLKAIQLIAPTTPPDRMATIAASASGFIYYVSREGVTGEQATLSDSIRSQVAEIRRHTGLPIAVGFGISTPDQAAEVAKSGDAVVVGSAIVRKIAEFGAEPDLAERISAFVRPLVEASKGVNSADD